MSQTRRHAKKDSGSFSSKQESPVITNVKDSDKTDDKKYKDPLYWHPDHHPAKAAFFRSKSKEIEAELKADATIESAAQQAANSSTPKPGM